ncbi:MAG: nucleotidyltransferase family protein [Bacteroidota bacterium]
MTQQEIINIILDHLKGYQPVSVGIFGSYARGENTENSDIDILVKFKVAPSLLTLIKLENELSDLLSIKVDLITTGAIKNKRVQRSIKKDLINIL